MSKKPITRKSRPAPPPPTSATPPTSRPVSADAGTAPPGRPGPTAKPARPPVPPARAAKPAKAKTPAKREMGALDAAAVVLAQAGKPMRCTDLTEKILAKRLWATKGRTPAATIHAGLIREIRDKGKASRFRKVGRGMFAATGKGR